MKDCIFCSIIQGKIKAEMLYEDELFVIIKDIQPLTKIHLLMIPKQHYADITEINEEQSLLLGKMFKTLGGLVDKLGLKNGFRLVINKGSDGCQAVGHLHVHILGGEQLCDKFV